MIAAILSIGTELTRGELINSNSAWLGEQLTSLGFDVIEHVVVADDLDRIVATLHRLAADARIIVVTGGLGPTTDDLTTLAAARAVGVGLERDPHTVEKMRRRWASFGREMPESNLKQADFPVGATILPNPVGTAPGFLVTMGEKTRAFFLPGVPSEMKQIYRESIIPSIAPGAERRSHQIRLRSFGHTESQVGDLVQGLEEAHPGITLGFRASFPEIEVKVLARADDEAKAECLAKEVAEKVRERLGDAVYGEEGDTFPAAVGACLRSKGLTLALAESCTGGLVGALVTSVPGSSEYLLMDAVVYSNAAKTQILGVSEDLLRGYGAVSAETASAMAEGALRASGADIAASVTGIAGPGGGSEAKPVGTVWFAVAQKGRPTVTKHRRLPGDRERIRTLASYVALRMIMRAALGKPADG